MNKKNGELHEILKCLLFTAQQYQFALQTVIIYFNKLQ